MKACIEFMHSILTYHEIRIKNCFKMNFFHITPYTTNIMIYLQHRCLISKNERKYAFRYTLGKLVFVYIV